ncbi:Cora-domain-containing protein [Madurella fahalii]|uniref:Cora-domain-containing protein n=1 Tax=Madurella fahalii TaxID=1157608 RepID=A0ABQ0G3K8_9PEZI
MDWPAFERPFLSDDDLPFFKCEESTLPSKVLRHSSEALKAPPKSEGREMTDRSGYHILLSARVLPVQTNPEVPSGLQYLPIERNIWKQIAQRFKLHSVIRKALQRKKSYSTCLTSKSTIEPVELFTAVISAAWPSNIAISSTYFTKSKLTLAVIYGCNGMQMKKIEDLLKMSPEVRDHPFLMAGIFAELQRDRVESLVLGIEKKLDDIMTEDLKFHRVDVPEEARGLNWRRSHRISLFRGEVKKLEEEARTVKGELKKMVRHMASVAKKEENRIPRLEQEKEEIVQDFITKTERFIERFEEICTELDSMMGKCRFASEELTFAREVFMAELARKEAHNTSQQTRMSTVIGFVAMLYLPITAMATIFATPVFDFKNDWQDIRLNHLGPSDSDQSSSGDQNLPVVSGYFWWYFLSSALLILVTLIYWYTKRKDKDNGPSGSNDEAEDSHNIESKTPTVVEGKSETSRSVSKESPSSHASHRRFWNPRSWFGSIRKSEDSLV